MVDTSFPFLLKHPPRVEEETWRAVTWGHQLLLNHFRKVSWGSAGLQRSLPDSELAKFFMVTNARKFQPKTRQLQLFLSAADFASCIVFLGVRFEKMSLKKWKPSQLLDGLMYFDVLFCLSCTNPSHRPKDQILPCLYFMEPFQKTQLVQLIEQNSMQQRLKATEN